MHSTRGATDRCVILGQFPLHSEFLGNILMNNGSQDPIKPREAGDLLLRPHVFLVRHKGAKQNKPLNIQVQSSDKVSIKNKPTMTIDTVFFTQIFTCECWYGVSGPPD